MSLCSCPRCTLLSALATAAAADGDIETAITLASQITVFDEGYSDPWFPETLAESVVREIDAETN